MMRLSSLFIFLLFFGQSHAQGVSDSIYIGDTILSQEIFPYDSLTHYRISDTLDRSIPVGEELYEEMFSGIKSTAWFKNGKITVPPEGDEQYLLSTRLCSVDFGEMYQTPGDTTYAFNVISFLSENDSASHIYWLSFYADPPVISVPPEEVYEGAGDWGQFGTYASLMESDTVFYQKRSQLLNDTLMKMTVVEDFKDRNRRDSTVHYLDIHLSRYDHPTGIAGELFFRNDSLVHKYLDGVPEKYLKGSGYSKE